MKMVKSLLLGSAAGLVVVAGAQAADLPVKAKPVEYVKICSLYGAGFYYIPGTDTCIKIGGYVRYQAYYNTGGGNTTFGPFGGGIGAGSAFSIATVGSSYPGQDTRLNQQGSDFTQRVRAVYTMDTRTQTEWGTLRTYVLFGFSQDTSRFSNLSGAAAVNTGLPGFYATRAFIQWAGFTFGKAQSFYDIFPAPAYSYFALFSHDTGDSGNNLAAYTLQLGNGWSTTLSLEDPRRTSGGVVNATLTNQFALGSVSGAEDTNVRWPDAVLNFRLDQAWGSWQVMGALHDVSGAYYASAGSGAAIGAGTVCAGGADPFTGTGVGSVGGSTGISGSMTCGHPNDRLGFAVGTGANINADFINKGDKFAFTVNYAEGALRYLAASNGGTSYAGFGGANDLGYGFFVDGIYANGDQIHLTKGWQAAAAYDHLWTPSLKTSIYGTYTSIQFDDAAARYICFNMGTAAGPTNTLDEPTDGACSQDWNYWQVGSRTQWNIRPDFYLGVDVMYQKLETANSGTFQSYRTFTAAVSTSATAAAGTGTARPSGLYSIQDQDALSLTFRAHRDIVP